LSNLFKIFDAGPEQFERVAKLFTCPACSRDVMRGGRFLPQAADFMMFAGCECVVVSYWELETKAPDIKSWGKLIRIARKNGVDLIAIDPNTEFKEWVWT
jgi:hypothetical protein